MKILGINGIETDGSDNTDILLAELAKLGHDVVDANYRKTKLFRFQTYEKKRQYEDAKFIGEKYWEEDCAVVAHSRGALVWWRMALLGYRFKAVFLFRPAMNRDFMMPINQDKIFCIHRPDDRAIKWGGRLPFNDFGNAGRFGLDDERVTNIEAPNYKNSEFWRHSDDFLYLQVNQWARRIHSTLQHG